MKHDLDIRSVSDIHLFNPNTPTRDVVDGLRAEFNKETLQGAHILTIVGDLFDRRGSLDSEESHLVAHWIADTLSICKDLDITVLVLEGTPSHDWKQARWMNTINTTSNINADLTYIDKLCIHRCEKYGISILCVPDEWRPDPLDTQREVVEIMAKEGLDKVDFALMHGNFPHQLPKGIPAPMHDTDFYLSVVKHLIFIGHVHQHSVHERIVAQGSFDRYLHGDEQPKGYIKAHVTEKDFSIIFVENHRAKIYHTIDCSGLGMPESLSKIDSDVDYPPGSSLRVIASQDDPVLYAGETIRERYPHFQWQLKPKDGGTRKINVNNRDTDDDHTLPPITRDNIREHVEKELKLKRIDGDIARACLSILDGAS